MRTRLRIMEGEPLSDELLSKARSRGRELPESFGCEELRLRVLNRLSGVVHEDWGFEMFLPLSSEPKKPCDSNRNSQDMNSSNNSNNSDNKNSNNSNMLLLLLLLQQQQLLIITIVSRRKPLASGSGRPRPAGSFPSWSRESWFHLLLKRGD